MLPFEYLVGGVMKLKNNKSCISHGIHRMEFISYFKHILFIFFMLPFVDRGMLVWILYMYYFRIVG